MTATYEWIIHRPPTERDVDERGCIFVPEYRPGIKSQAHSIKLDQYLSIFKEVHPWCKTRRKSKSQVVQLDVNDCLTEQCGTCRFFMKWSKPGGECRRNAPQAVALHADIDDFEHIAYWPGIDESDWCGEWEARQ